MPIKLLKKAVKYIFLPKSAEVLIEKNDFALSIENTPKYFYYSGGIENDNILFYVIQRSPGAGLFSNLTFIINHLSIVDKLGAIPILDSFNFPNLYNESIRNNSWSNYLNHKNNITLEEVYNSKNVLVTSSNWNSNFPMSMSQITNCYSLFHKYFQINEQILKIVNEYVATNFINENVLGIHFRGGDQKTANNHPFPATKKQMYNKIKNLLQEYNFTKIFVSTESADNFKFLNKKFGDKLIYYNSYRSQKNAYLENPRLNHRQQLGEEIIIEALILSKTNYFLCSNSNVSEFVKILRKNENKETLELRNGTNSSNPILALFMFKIKSLLPSFLGGFKNYI
jgi:hypothetical protein